MTKSARCTCRTCKLIRALEPLRKRATRAQLKALDAILLDWEHHATEAVYWRMKYQGTWPQ